MAIEELVSELLQNAGIEWTVTSKDGETGSIKPEVEDVYLVLEELATKMVERSHGDSMAVGGIMMEKKHGGNSVYVYVGDYI